MTARQLIEDYGYEDVLIFENPSYDDAFIGVSEDNRAVYDYDKMVLYLMDKDKMTAEDAVDFISYNTIRSLPYYENSPIIVYSLTSEFEEGNDADS